MRMSYFEDEHRKQVKRKEDEERRKSSVRVNFPVLGSCSNCKREISDLNLIHTGAGDFCQGCGASFKRIKKDAIRNL